MNILFPERHKYLKYLSISVIVTTVDYLIFFSLYHHTGILLAHTFSYITAILLSFNLQKRYVFQKKRSTALAFSCVLSFSLLGISLGYIVLYVYNWLFQSIITAKIFMTATMFFYNYFSKRFSFGEHL